MFRRIALTSAQYARRISTSSARSSIRLSSAKLQTPFASVAASRTWALPAERSFTSSAVRFSDAEDSEIFYPEIQAHVRTWVLCAYRVETRRARVSQAQHTFLCHERRSAPRRPASARRVRRHAGEIGHI